MKKNILIACMALLITLLAACKIKEPPCPAYSKANNHSEKLKHTNS